MGRPSWRTCKPKTGISKVLERFNNWFDQKQIIMVMSLRGHYIIVVGWVFLPYPLLSLPLALQATLGGSSFLPASIAARLMINIRTPSSSSLEYARLKVEKAASS